MVKFGSFKSFALTLLLWGGFFTYLWMSVVHDAPDGLRIGAAYMWGDWALHYIVSSVAAFRPMSCWFTNHPVYLGNRFDYPFVVDFISGLLQREGAALGSSFLWPSIALMFVLLSAIYLFSQRITKSGIRSFLALSLLFLNGGLGFVDIIMDWSATPNFWQQFPQHIYSHWPERGYQYGNMTITEFLPQRAFLLGMPIGLFLIAQLVRMSNRPTSSKPIAGVLIGILAGCLLFIHPHSYLVIVLFSAFIVISRPTKWRAWVRYGIGAIMPSLIWWFGMHNHSGGFFEWYPGWMAYEPGSGNLGFLPFWFLNWGLFLPLAVLGTIRFKLYRDPVVIFGYVLFILCNFIKFQPWSWDNTKLFTYSYLFLAIPVAFAVAEFLFARNRAIKFVGVMLLLSLTLTGIIDLFGIIKNSSPGYMMYSQEEFAMAAEVKSKTDACDVILTSTDHHHWLPALTGRQILMGYPGWVASYGVNYGERDKDIHAMYDGAPNARALMNQYQIKYALISGKELPEYKPNQAYFEQNFPVVFELNGAKLYRITDKPQ